MKLGLQTVLIRHLIRRNWLETEMRLRINETKVEQYAVEIKGGADFPPPVVFVDHDELYRVGDGFHRILAKKLNKETHVDVLLKQGGYREAFMHGIAANRKQLGLPFTLGDLEKCILTLMRDEETSKWTQQRISETVGCSQGYVSQVVKKFAIDRPAIVIDRRGKTHSRPCVTKESDETEARRQLALEMFMAGEKKKDIAEALNVGRSTVQNYIQDCLDEQSLVPCQHCNGSGFVQRGKRNKAS